MSSIEHCKVTTIPRTTFCNLFRDPSKNSAGLFGRELTPRQREVLQLIAEGKSMEEIASILQISLRTVEFHRNGIMQELGLHATAELT